MPALAAAVLPADRERRLRARIDSIAARCDAKERRILQLEDALRLTMLSEDERAFVLEGRLKHLNRRLIELSEENRALRQEMAA